MTAELKNTEEMVGMPEDLVGEILTKVTTLNRSRLEEEKHTDLEPADIVNQVLMAAAIIAEGYGAKADDFEAQSRDAWEMVESFAQDESHVIH
tara:strand:+ start:686 stop:964 length:279 start_codon:yes stop_codon:yes gene_type:complete